MVWLYERLRLTDNAVKIDKGLPKYQTRVYFHCCRVDLIAIKSKRTASTKTGERQTSTLQPELALQTGLTVGGNPHLKEPRFNAVTAVGAGEGQLLLTERKDDPAAFTGL